MFYDYELGQAQYRAPLGVITGELTRKRQFKIENGRMLFALESAVNIQDDVLQRELSATSDEKMKTIIATIQKEQNRIIRDETAQVMIIQGVAGSGKTSIALHRVAYLMYRQQGRLTAANVAILSPNRVFGDYISGVLPELGEEPIVELSFPLLAAIQLEGVASFLPERDPVETRDPAWAERARLKASPDFLIRLEEYMEYAAIAYFDPTDYAQGRFRLTKEWILERYRAYGRHPVKRRIREVAADMRDRFETDNIMEDVVPTAKAIEKKLLGMYKMKSTMALYRDFYQTRGLSGQLALPAGNTLEWEDVYPFLYLHAGFEGLRAGKAIRHVVIDEMQDYTPVQYAVINLLFDCPKTILGDFGQSVNPCHSHSLESFRLLYSEPKIVELNTSYRSSCEIIRFAGRILNVEKLRPVERHGEEPGFLACADRAGELAWIRRRIGEFRAGGRTSLGIITKTHAEAEKLFGALGGDIHLLTPESEAFESGISVVSVRMAKGLEFDEVIVPFADAETYHTPEDRNLLYIACTRAMHRLTLLYSGRPTPLYAE